MSKLVVTLDWPYSNIPWILFKSIWDSDIRTEPNVEIIRAVSTDMTCTANMLVKHSIEIGATEILQLSADQSVPRDILSRLRAHDKDVVGCLTATRQPGHHWLVFDLDENGIGRKKTPKFPLEKCDVAAAGCLLIKAKIFNTVPGPWYKATLTKDGTNIVQTSDFYFFKKLKEYGIDVYVDSTLESYHQTEVVLNANNLGRTLPYLEVIPGNTDIPRLAEDIDKLDEESGRYVDYDVPNEHVKDGHVEVLYKSGD